MRNAPYTDEQKQFIRDNCGNMTAKELTELFNSTFNENRTKKGIQYIVLDMGLNCIPSKKHYTVFTEEQQDFMRRCATTMSRRELADLFYETFGIEISFNTIRMWCSRQKLLSPNGDGRYTSETSPRWQAGLSKEEFRSHYSDESFAAMTDKIKEMQIQHHIGDEVIRHGIPHIVVNDDFGNGIDARLEKKARYVWKQHHGDIPDDCMIINLDGDPMNCDISNLRCMKTKYRAMFRHNGWWSTPSAVKETALTWCDLYYALKDSEMIGGE